MTRLHRLVGPLVGLFSFALAPSLHAKDGETPLDAFTAVMAVDMAAAAAVDRCRDLGEPAAGQVKAAYINWRARYGVHIITGQLLRSVTREQHAAWTEAARRTVDYHDLSHFESLGEACRYHFDKFGLPKFDMRAQHPMAYDTSGQPLALAAALSGHQQQMASHPQLQAGASAGDFAGNEYQLPQPARPVAPLHGVAQIATMLRGAGWDAKQRVYVRGRVVQKGNAFFLEDDDPIYESSNSLWAGTELSSWVGREVIVGAALERVAGYGGELRYTRLVRDSSGLTPSTLKPTYGSRSPKRSAISTAPGKGIQPDQLAAVHLHAHATTSGGWAEDVYVVLQDGSAYLRTDIAPCDLNLVASRKLEPDQWKRAPEGGFPGVRRSPWKPGTRIDGTFTSNSFTGNAMTGGVYSETSVTFAPDGRFSTTHTSQAGSGTLAGISGFSAGTTSVSDGSGTTSTSSGGNGQVFASASSQRNDGASHRGTYRFDGYLLELRYDDGKVERMLSFPTGEPPPDGLFMWGHWYTRPRPN